MKIIMRFKIRFGLIMRTSTTAASIQFADQNRINFFANIHGLRMRNLLFLATICTLFHEPKIFNSMQLRFHPIFSDHFQVVFQEVQVNLCQKHLFLDQLTHNMMTDCSLNVQYKKNKSSEHVCTQIIFCFCFDISSFHVLNS